MTSSPSDQGLVIKKLQQLPTKKFDLLALSADDSDALGLRDLDDLTVVCDVITRQARTEGTDQDAVCLIFNFSTIIILNLSRPTCSSRTHPRPVKRMVWLRRS